MELVGDVEIWFYQHLSNVTALLDTATCLAAVAAKRLGSMVSSSISCRSMLGMQNLLLVLFGMLNSFGASKIGTASSNETTSSAPIRQQLYYFKTFLSIITIIFKHIMVTIFTKQLHLAPYKGFNLSCRRYAIAPKRVEVEDILEQDIDDHTSVKDIQVAKITSS